MNQRIKPLDNLKVRQAVAHGLDRTAVVKAFYGGRGTLRTSSCRRWSWATPRTGPAYPYNPEKASSSCSRLG